MRYLLIIVFFLSLASCQLQEQERRTLKVSLYPYIPNRDNFYRKVTDEFEKKHPDIQLIITTNDSYYDSGGIMDEVSDVYELDAVFLKDFIAASKIQALPSAIWPQKSDIPNLGHIAYQNDQWYGYPHWLCGNFLFYEEHSKVGTAKTLTDVEKAMPKVISPSNGLLVDFKGSSTLGEMYLDALMDEYKTYDAAKKYLDPNNIDTNVIANMRRVLPMTYEYWGRDSAYHERTGFYARLFSRNRGVAYVGYSESLYHFTLEQSQSCKYEDSCLDTKRIHITEWPLSDKGSQPIGWTDMLVVDSKVKGQKLKDAEEFIKFMVSDSTYYMALLPDWGDAPRYLLPGKLSLYSDKAILDAAPLYTELLPIIQKATPVTDARLASTIKAIGKKIDTMLSD